MLTPNFLPDGYTISDAIKKNDNNICGYKNCSNKLNNPPKYGYGGIKICEECRKPIDEWCEQIDLESDERTINMIKNFLNKEKQ